MDAGATAVAAIEAFEDAGQPYPVINGEDQQDFLVKWQEERPDGHRSDLPHLPVAHGGHRRPEGAARRGSSRPVAAAATRP
jgi:hypothetical protein